MLIDAPGRCRPPEEVMSHPNTASSSRGAPTAGRVLVHQEP